MDEAGGTKERSPGALLMLTTPQLSGSPPVMGLPGRRTRHNLILAEDDAEFVWVMDMDFEIRGATASAEELLGYHTQERPLAWWMQSVLTPYTLNRCRAMFLEIQRSARNDPPDTSRSWTLEMEFVRRDGTTFLAETTVNLLYDLEGNPCAMVCVSRDITRPRREQELFRALARNSPIGIYIIRNGRFRFVNRQIEECLKYSHTELMGAEAVRFVFPEDRDRVRRLARAMLRSERFEPYEFRVICKDGEIRWVMEMVSSIQHGNGRAVLGALMDVTERKRVEEDLRKSESQLRQLTQRMLEIQERERARFARDLHDQLGQDLVFLKIQAESLARSLVDMPQLEEKAMEIAGVADRLKTTSNRIAANIGPGILDGLGLIGAIEWCCEDFERRTGISCPVDAPVVDIRVSRPTATAAYRILQEALTNVWRHAGASQSEVKLEKDGDWVVLSIADNGVGIGAGLLSRKPTLGFLGMYERARLAGGTLSVSSIPGKGTRIVARLPAGDE